MKQGKEMYNSLIKKGIQPKDAYVYITTTRNILSKESIKYKPLSYLLFNCLLQGNDKLFNFFILMSGRNNYKFHDNIYNKIIKDRNLDIFTFKNFNLTESIVRMYISDFNIPEDEFVIQTIVPTYHFNDKYLRTIPIKDLRSIHIEDLQSIQIKDWRAELHSEKITDFYIDIQSTPIKEFVYNDIQSINQEELLGKCLNFEMFLYAIIFILRDIVPTFYLTTFYSNNTFDDRKRIVCEVINVNIGSILLIKEILLDGIIRSLEIDDLSYLENCIDCDLIKIETKYDVARIIILSKKLHFIEFINDNTEFFESGVHIIHFDPEEIPADLYYSLVENKIINVV